MPFPSISSLRESLIVHGCTRCSLGFQPGINGCCVSRGDPAHGRMIIGEAPGKEEDSRRLPFTGPAGQLMDRIFAAVGWDTWKDWYCTNVVKCRPVAERGSGRENLTPLAEQQRQCRMYLEEELRIIHPRLVVLVGKIAASIVLPGVRDVPMHSLHGHVYEQAGVRYFVMYHPAAILHASNDPEKHLELRRQTWEDIQALRRLADNNQL